MTAVQVLAALRARGARVEVRSGRLRIEAPKGVLDVGLRAALDAGKAELLDLLTAEPHALVAATFARIARWWVEGAVLPARELEDAVDRAALAGDLTALAAALFVYEQAAREASGRMRSDIRPAGSAPSAATGEEGWARAWGRDGRSVES